MKTKLFGFLLMLASLSMSGQIGTYRVTLTSTQTQFDCNDGRKGAYFDLTYSNRVLRNSIFFYGINTNEFFITEYDLNDFGPSGPLEPINNYFSCGGVEIYTKVQSIFDPSLFYTVIITLIVNRPVPIHYYHEIYNSPKPNGSGDYFYTNNYSTIGNGSIAGFTYKGVAFNAYKTFSAGTIPIYRYFNFEYVNHFYTKSPFNNYALYGYAYEGIEFYAYNYNHPGTVPVYRYFSPSLSNHFYTTNFNLYGSGGSGYTYEGIEFYAFPANANSFKEAANAEATASKIESSPVTLFPNPTTGLVTINNNSKTIESVIVNDILGKTVQTKTINDKTAQLDLSDLSKGIYYVKVKSDGIEKVTKVIKE
jgi:hypothetical protein